MKLQLILLLGLLLLFFAETVHAVRSATPTPHYSNYIRTAFIVTSISLFLIMTTVNSVLFALLFRRFSLSYKVSKLILFSSIVTLVSFTVNLFIYIPMLPNTSSLFDREFISGFLSLDSASMSFQILLMITLRLIIPGGIVVLIVSYFLIRKLFTLEKNLVKLSLCIAAISIPIIGLFVAYYLTETYFNLFPFIGEKFSYS